MRFHSLWLVAAASFVLAGCGGSGNGLINVPNPRGRFANVFPGVSSAKVKVGDDIIGDSSGIGFGTVSEYIVTDNGNKDLTAGDSTFDNLATLPGELYETEKRYTGIGYGSSPRTILLLQDNKDQASSGTVSLRLANVAQSKGALDVYVTDSTAGDTLPGSPAFPNVGVGVVSDFSSVPAASGPLSARIRVFAQGQVVNPLVDKTVVLDSRERAAILVYEDSGETSGVNALVVKENL